MTDPARVTVWAASRLPGFHCWPGAAGARSYLGDRHRHLFHVKASALVSHDDRDTEFHDLLRMIRDWWGPGDRECGPASCETLARELAGYLTDRGVAVASAEVSEDGEAGAVVTFAG